MLQRNIASLVPFVKDVDDDQKESRLPFHNTKQLRRPDKKGRRDRKRRSMRLTSKRQQVALWDTWNSANSVFTGLGYFVLVIILPFMSISIHKDRGGSGAAVLL